ncbi:MAG: hypothetical protein ACI9KE_000860 [Polyangiales bacterium]|jgi:hypothetical protein
MKTFSKLCFALMSSLLLSCAEDIEPTEVILVIDSDLSAPTEVDSVDVAVFSAGGEEMNSFATLGVGDARFPRTLGIYNVDTRLESYRLVARARLGGEILVTRTATFDFVRDRAMRLTLFLPAACADVRCEDGLTCTEGGVCRSTDVELERWTGSPTGISVSIDAGTP